MAIYEIGSKDITLNDIKDINPAPEQSVANHPLAVGGLYIRLGKANGQATPALHFAATSTVELPNTSDVKESERGGQLRKLIDAGLVTVSASALTDPGDSTPKQIKVS